MTATSIRSAVDGARRRVLKAVLREDHPAVVVDSPPGAGKTSLVQAVVATAVRHDRLRVGVVATTVNQAEDIARRIRTEYQPFQLELLHSKNRPPPADLLGLGVQSVTRAGDLAGGPGAVVTNARKLAFSSADLGPNAFDLLVVDEAYQLKWKDVAEVCHLAPRLLLVGDPGQLPPIVRGDVARFEAARHHVHWAAPREFLHRHPQLPRIRLPATWRFPGDTVRIVQPSFYPNLPFESAADDDDRRLSFAAAGMGDAVDRALDLVASGASIVGVLLPRRPFDLDEVDEEIASLAARIARRILDRGPEWVGRGALDEAQIGYVDAHVASGAAVRRGLRRAGIGPRMMTDTPEVWQGLQRPIMIVKHTLSGGTTFDGFSLEPGRLSVMTTRHQLGCIIVGRDGTGEALERHRHNCADRPSGADDAEWTGWLAHRTLWSTLEREGRLVRT